MSGDVMNFPNTWEEYEEQYGFNDTEQVYTNGSRLIQSFRVKQWLEHIEVSEDAISRANLIKSFLADCECESREDARAVTLNLEDMLELIEEEPSVIPKENEVIYGNEHNCIMTLFGECSYSETGCGDCAVIEKVRDALAKTQIETQNSNENSKECEWIPCSERLPADDELMLVTYVDPRPEAMDIWIGWHEMENVWYIDGEAHSNELGNEVIAWMPLPKPWKGADNE